jgi:hypothetical protein
MPIQTNLQPFRRSRHVPARGDTFVMQLPSRQYLFGRVILAEPPEESAPGPSTNLVYIYTCQSSTKTPDYRQLTADRLLLPPIWTNRLGWTRGIFQTIDNQPLRKHDFLAQHCFRDSFRAIYLDERGRKLPSRVEPRGEWGLVSYRWIDDHVSDALGIPRVPESSED